MFLCYEEVVDLRYITCIQHCLWATTHGLPHLGRGVISDLDFVLKLPHPPSFHTQCLRTLLDLLLNNSLLTYLARVLWY